MSQSRTDPALRNAQPMNEDKHQPVTPRPAPAAVPIEKERGIEQTDPSAELAELDGVGRGVWVVC